MRLRSVNDLTRISGACSGNVSCDLSNSEEVLNKTRRGFTVNSLSCSKTKAAIHNILNIPSLTSTKQTFNKSTKIKCHIHSHHFAEK